MHIDHEERALAQQLTDATRAGRMADAYRVLQGIPFKMLPAVALHAGYSCISTASKRDFTAHLVSQVADASRRKTDGWGLRKQNPPANAG